MNLPVPSTQPQPSCTFSCSFSSLQLSCSLIFVRILQTHYQLFYFFFKSKTRYLTSPAGQSLLYGLACLYPPQVHMLKPWAHVEVFGGGAFWEGSTVRGAMRVVLPRGDWCPSIKRYQEACSLTLCHERIQDKAARVQARRAALPRHWISWHLDLGRQTPSVEVTPKGASVWLLNVLPPGLRLDPF